MEPEFNDLFDKPLKDLCKKLLRKDPTKRLGYSGIDDIVAHEWFTSGFFDWEQCRADQLKPPFAPGKSINAKSQEEIGESWDDESKKWALEPADHEQYKPWTFTSPRAFQEELVIIMKAEEENGGKSIVGKKSAESGCCVLS